MYLRNKRGDIMKEIHTCCLCGCLFEGFGNNPYPLSEEGRCCDECNDKVIQARIEQLQIQKDNKEEK